MLDRLFPATQGSPYRGNVVAIWLVAGVLLLKVVTALAAIFNGRYAASVADGIPLDSFSPQGAQAVVALFGALGVSQVLLSAFGALLIAKYRALLPAFTLLLVTEFIARKLVSWFIPIERVAGNAGTPLNWVIFAALLAALMLSLQVRGNT